MYLPASDSWTPRMLRNQESLIKRDQGIEMRTTLHCLPYDYSVPIVKCGGESVVLSDHIRKYGDNPLLRVKPCNLQWLYHQVWNHPVHFRVENSILQQFYGHLNVSWIIIKVVKFDCNFDIVSQKFFWSTNIYTFDLLLLRCSLAGRSQICWGLLLTGGCHFLSPLWSQYWELPSSSALYWYLLATAIFNFYKLDNWWSLGITGDTILSSSNINSNTVLNTKLISLFYLF